MKKAILIIIPLLVLFSVIIGVAVKNNPTETKVAQNNETTVTTRNSEYPTESECVAKINSEFASLMAGSGYNIKLVFNKYIDKSAEYKVQLSGNMDSIGTVLLSSPISSEYDGYGYITGVVVSIDNSALPYSSDSLNIVQSETAVPIYAYAKLRNKHTGETLSDFQRRFSLVNESSTCYIHAISGEDIIFVTNKYQLKCAAAYGENECGLLRESIGG